MEIDVEKIVHALAREGYGLSRRTPEEIVLFKAVGDDVYKFIKIPRSNPFEAVIVYDTGVTDVGKYFCENDGKFYDENDHSCPKRPRYLFEEKPELFKGKGYESYSNTPANKKPPYCLEAQMCFKYNTLTREEFEKILARYGGVTIPGWKYLPEEFYDPKASRRNLARMIAYLYLKKEMTPTLNFGTEKCKNPNPSGFRFENTPSVILTELMLTSSDYLNDRNSPVTASFRYHLIMKALIEALINLKDRDYDERVRVIYAIPLYAPEGMQAYLVGLNKSGTDVVFNRVVYMWKVVDDAKETLILSDAINWIPADLLVFFSAEDIARLSKKGFVVEIDRDKLGTNNWNKIRVAPMKNGCLGGYQKAVVEPLKRHNATVQHYAGKLIITN